MQTHSLLKRSAYGINLTDFFFSHKKNPIVVNGPGPVFMNTYRSPVPAHTHT